jgi:hypothetical protein
MSEKEPCIFVRKNGKKLLVIALYVDDMLFFSDDDAECTNVKEQLMTDFKMKDLGEAKYALGIRISQSNQEITLDQEEYIDELLRRFNMKDCKGVSTPMVPNVKLEKQGTFPKKGLPYQSLIGSVMFLAVNTRPDIVFAVNYLSQFNNCYSVEHWEAAKRILRYLKSTTSIKLVYKATGKNIFGFVDANWGGDCDDKDTKSYSGYVFIWGNAAISWETSKQRSSAVSSTESEYMAISEAAKEAVFLREFTSELLGKENQILIFNDNQSALFLSEQNAFHKRSKHIKIRYNFVRELIEEGEIKLDYCPSHEMLADLFTKPLYKVKFNNFVSELGLIQQSD